MKAGLYTIDSIEEGKAMLLFREDESIAERVPLSVFPFDVQEGDLVSYVEHNGSMGFVLEREKTEALRKKAQALKEKLLKKKK